LSLSTAEVSVLLASNTICVTGRLGNLALNNDLSNHKTLEEFRDILSIEGQNFAEFKYETFNPNEEGYDGIRSSVSLHAASLKLNFLAEPIRGILVFISKLAKLKALYDAATQAAAQTASNVDVGCMKYDVTIKTPILVYPRDPERSHQTLVMKLGEFNLKNSLEDMSNKTFGTLDGIQLVSSVHREEEISTLTMIENINIQAEVIQSLVTSQSSPVQAPSIQVSYIYIYSETAYLNLIFRSRSIFPM
jgi:vacuolar protein sorting-associated protein 13A/C